MPDSQCHDKAGASWQRPVQIMLGSDILQLHAATMQLHSQQSKDLLDTRSDFPTDASLSFVSYLTASGSSTGLCANVLRNTAPFRDAGCLGCGSHQAP